MTRRHAPRAGAVAGLLALAVASATTIAAAGQDAPVRRDIDAYVGQANRMYNVEAIVPPQCYTKHAGKHNPCYTCHQTYTDDDRPNYMADQNLQSEYAFSEIGVTNHWKNLFVDRSKAVAEVSDREILDYIREDNYSGLDDRLADSDWRGYVPDLKNLDQGAAAFGPNGFARDGSGWVAFNYKPLPSTFWPTNGSTDDVLIRLPEPFQETAAGKDSRDVYMANLAILEAAMKELDQVSVPATDETAVGVDLNGDGEIATAYKVRRRARYLGGASDTEVDPMLYPQGTEFLHTVRYVGVDGEEIRNARRMKELRYMRKIRKYDRPQLASLYGNEHQEKLEGNLPRFVDTGGGLDNGMGWIVSGFIENAQGELRPQTREETKFCMGCHGSIGATLDQTFAFPRKVTGADGWGYIDLRGMKDAPSRIGPGEGEILTYLKRVGGGDEFRRNAEMRRRWFDDDGALKTQKVKQASVYELITPSRERALKLNKAYRAIVREQSFIYGRQPTVKPADNVYREVDPETAPTLPEDKVFDYDIRLDWRSVRD